MNKTTKANTPDYEQGHAFLDMGDQLYRLAEALGLPDEWATLQQQQVRDSVLKLKNIDLNEA